MCSQGIAAAVCRHEFVLVAVNLFTHENFVYYELMLEHLLNMYDTEKGRKLHSFFLDIVCQFDPYWRRCVPACTLLINPVLQIYGSASQDKLLQTASDVWTSTCKPYCFSS